ncbi:MAG TPA: zinc transporter ZupT [Epsilonproteobacteria bacterium]|nr:zinc transporter ZupT [Campylobacterota bacterium]
MYEDINLSTFLIAFGLTFFAGISSVIGGFIAISSKRDNLQFLSIGLGFSAGVMLYISFVEILPKAIDEFNVLYTTQNAMLIGTGIFFVGFILTYFIDSLVPDNINPHHTQEIEHNICSLDKTALDKHQRPLRKIGIFVALAIALHNFPEGFATFVATLSSIELGVDMAIAIALHNIPEGLAVSLPIYSATGDKKKAIWYAFASGMAEPIGALVGFLVLAPLLGNLTLGLSFAIIGGVMVYISLDELLPASRLYGDDHTTILGVGSGMAVMAISLIYLG